MTNRAATPPEHKAWAHEPKAIDIAIRSDFAHRTSIARTTSPVRSVSLSTGDERISMPMGTAVAARLHHCVASSVSRALVARLSSRGPGRRPGPDAVDFVGRHGNANAAAADTQTAVGLTITHGSPHGGAEVGVVDTIIGVGAAVDDVVATIPKVGGEPLLEMESGMVRSNSDAHSRILGRKRQRGRRSASAGDDGSVPAGRSLWIDACQPPLAPPLRDRRQSGPEPSPGRPPLHPRPSRRRHRRSSRDPRRRPAPLAAHGRVPTPPPPMASPPHRGCRAGWRRAHRWRPGHCRAERETTNPHEGSLDLRHDQAQRGWRGQQPAHRPTHPWPVLERCHTRSQQRAQWPLSRCRDRQPRSHGPARFERSPRRWPNQLRPQSRDAGSTPAHRP